MDFRQRVSGLRRMLWRWFAEFSRGCARFICCWSVGGSVDQAVERIEHALALAATHFSSSRLELLRRYPERGLAFRAAGLHGLRRFRSGQADPSFADIGDGERDVLGVPVDQFIRLLGQDA